VKKCGENGAKKTQAMFGNVLRKKICATKDRWQRVVGAIRSSSGTWTKP
jgi:hypothetical protein